MARRDRASQQRDWFEAIFPGLLFLAILLRYATSSTARPDFLAAALAFGGFIAYLRYLGADGRHRTQRLILAATLCGFALLTKQSTIAAPVAIGLHLLARGRIRDAAMFSAFTLAWPLMFYAALWTPTRGGVWLMTAGGIGQSFNLMKMLEFGVVGYLGSGFVLLTLGASALLLTDPERTDADTASVAYFLVGLGWFLVMAGNPGSSHNYFIEAAVSGALLIGALFARYRTRSETTRRTILAFLLAMLVGHSLPQAALVARVYVDVQEEQTIARILENLRTHEGQYVLADVNYVTQVIRAGHRPLIHDSYVYTIMSDKGTVDLAPFLQFLEVGHVPYLILQNSLEWYEKQKVGSRLWPAPVLQHLKAGYDCRTLLQKRTDGRLLVVCERRNEAGQTDRRGRRAGGAALR